MSSNDDENKNSEENYDSSVDVDEIEATSPPPPIDIVKQYHLAEITQNDVLCGHGGLTNYHKGNKQFRDLVNKNKIEYLNGDKTKKFVITRRVVKFIQKLTPPGRFLKQRNDHTGLWYEIPNRLAAAKTTQTFQKMSVEKKVEGIDKPKTTLKDNKQLINPSKLSPSIHEMKASPQDKTLLQNNRYTNTDVAVPLQFKKDDN